MIASAVRFLVPLFRGAVRREHSLRIVSAWVLALCLSPTWCASGTPWTGAPGIQRKTSDFTAYAPGRDHEHRPAPRRFEGDFQSLLPNPDSPQVPSSLPPDSSASSVATVGSPQTIGLNFTAATLSDTSAFPPDTMGAIGPTQFIIALNGRIRSFNRTTGVADGVLNVDPDIFFQSVMTPPVSNNFTSDPRIRYDRLSRRWFITIIDVPNKTGASPNRILLAVSDGPIISPTTVWTFFFFRHDQVSPAGDTGNFADYPTLGIDANALYIGVNVFGTRGQGTFSSTTGFVIRKSSVLGTGPIVVTAFRGLVVKVHGVLTGPYTPQGVDNYDPAATEGYFIGADPSYIGLINLRRVSNPGGTPTISGNVTISVPANGGTITVPHLGNTGGAAGNLDGIDIRLMGAHLRNGRLWTTANIGVNNVGSPSGTDTRNGVRWYELQGIATGQTPGVVQSGTVYQPSTNNTTDQRSYWMGSVMVSGQGHAAMGFSVAGATERVNAGTVGRLVSDPLGSMRTPQLYTASTNTYNPPSDPGSPEGRRWGDYSYTSLDPNDDMTMWTIQEFCNAENSYGVQVAKLLAPPPATPASCSPASIAAGSSNISVLVTGILTNGSGFFDPGAGFSNRIAAAFSAAGISINSIQYTDPSHLTLNVSVAANATAGAHLLTVTNPDGQVATSASGLLTVTGGNNPPTISSIGDQVINEDAATSALSFMVGDMETAPASLTVAASSSNTNLVQQSGFSFGGGGVNRTITVTPAPDQFGSTTISLTVTDSSGGTATSTFLLTVNSVNDAPSFVKGANQTVLEDAGSQTVTNWATAIAAGPANESAQNVDFVVTNDNNSLFAIQPAIAPDGTLTFTPAADASGSAIVTVHLHDDGGIANGGLDDSPPQTFTIAVTAVNDPPLLAAIADQTVNEGDIVTVTNIATDVDGPSLTFSLGVAPVGASINPSTGIFSWSTTEADGPGTNTVVVIVTDNGSPSLSATQSFMIIVQEVNTAPVLAPIASRTIHQGATISFTNSATDVDLPPNQLTYSLSNAPAGASIGAADGVFTWTPTPEQANTTNEITVVVADDGSPNLSHSQTFTATVLSPPIITSISQTDTNVTIVWTSIANTTYRVQYKSYLEESDWHDLPDDVMADSNTAMKTDALGPDSQRFYRILAIQ